MRFDPGAWCRDVWECVYIWAYERELHEHLHVTVPPKPPPPGSGSGAAALAAPPPRSGTLEEDDDARAIDVEILALDDEELVLRMMETIEALPPPPADYAAPLLEEEVRSRVRRAVGASRDMYRRAA